jgi:hypothetical protein
MDDGSKEPVLAPHDPYAGIPTHTPRNEMKQFAIDSLWFSLATIAIALTLRVLVIQAIVIAREIRK